MKLSKQPTKELAKQFLAAVEARIRRGVVGIPDVQAEETVGELFDEWAALPSWSSRRVLELAPVCWRQTVEHAEVQQQLADNIFRRASLNQLHPAGTSHLANVG